ncbi:histidine kinase [Microvirga subterranea]|uniref:Histidine kinase/DNA gyrase B/HSP90-like ATPase n=1 Tax=Microvirga subterranea TaxID=186651 RepID=A0A370HN72_9HYPH|nr:histidine kinase [Microvirga subterranea]RDI59770.1 histidine kinase/DNA gyrase B/HSP90-like ATPase [Microvirga subterranea]
MSNGTVPVVAQSFAGLRLRQRIAFTFMVITVAACLVAGALLLSRAADERHAIEHRAQEAAKALSFGFDQEVAAVNYLLKGLSKSPVLLSGDIRAFYDQLKTTPVPEGSWLVLNDLERQVANTLRPFGSPLPRHVDFPNYQEQLDRIRERRWSVSGRMMAPLKGKIVVALSLRLDDPDGRMSGHLTITLTEARLGTILDDQALPAGWVKGLYDRKLQPIVADRDGHKGSDLPVPAALATRLADAGPASTITGSVEAMDDRGVQVLVTFRRSGATNWTSVVTVPLADLNAPITAALRRMAGPAALLLLAGGIAAWFTARQIEQPLRVLSDEVTGAKEQVSELSGQLLALQEEERQRIARELHDSTAQHLVAANLGLAGLETEVRHSASGRKALAEIENLQTEALRELRIFTYLLHPPNLANDGLQATLRDFAEGFAGRTGLVARIRIPEEVDDLPPELQRAILRVVQEALTNVHRHAGASQVSVDARIRSGRLVVRIRDNGHGMAGQNGAESRIRLGVGVAGMRARLEQFGGDLRIKTGPDGTSVVAIVPVTVTGRALTQAGRMLRPWRPDMTEAKGKAHG